MSLSYFFFSKEYRFENYPSRYVDKAINSVTGIFGQKSYISTSAFQLSFQNSILRLHLTYAFEIVTYNLVSVSMLA